MSRCKPFSMRLMRDGIRLVLANHAKKKTKEKHHMDSLAIRTTLNRDYPLVAY